MFLLWGKRGKVYSKPENFKHGALIRAMAFPCLFARLVVAVALYCVGVAVAVGRGGAGRVAATGISASHTSGLIVSTTVVEIQPGCCPLSSMRYQEPTSILAITGSTSPS
jgi:hypothetical protein